MIERFLSKMKKAKLFITTYKLINYIQQRTNEIEYTHFCILYDVMYLIQQAVAVNCKEKTRSEARVDTGGRDCYEFVISLFN